MLNRHLFQTTRTARYFTRGNFTAPPTEQWLVLHGYGQLADQFLESLTAFDEERTGVLAPEALSRFYVKGISGETGASWMTRTERDDEIRDYINYLESLIQHVSTQKKWNVLGFSQGVPTLCRWLSETTASIGKVVLCSGIFPEDLSIDFLEENGAFAKHDIHFCFGRQDKLLIPEQREQLKEVAKQRDHLTIWEFDGRHEVNNDILKKIIAH